MERITISLEHDLARDFDALIERRGYASRSEAMRDLLRRAIEDGRRAYELKSHCVANLSYVYDHHARDLAERLTSAQHQHHDLVVSTMHVHLDHANCLESVVLKGSVAAVKRLAEQTQSERGVRHVALNLVTVTHGDEHHARGAHRHRGHMHLIPRT